MIGKLPISIKVSFCLAKYCRSSADSWMYCWCHHILSVAFVQFSDAWLHLKEEKYERAGSSLINNDTHIAWDNLDVVTIFIPLMWLCTARVLSILFQTYQIKYSWFQIISSKDKSILLKNVVLLKRFLNLTRRSTEQCCVWILCVVKKSIAFHKLYCAMTNYLLQKISFIILAKSKSYILVFPQIKRRYNGVVVIKVLLWKCKCTTNISIGRRCNVLNTYGRGGGRRRNTFLRM